MTSLEETLAGTFVPRQVPPDVLSRRRRLCEFIRTNEARVFDVGHPDAGTARSLLGWDDETMSAFIGSPLLCNSSPHAALNLFPPTLAYAWILRRAIEMAQQRHRLPAVHVRTLCTHHNFYDTHTKPHAWWHREPGGSVVKTQLFTRRPVRDHPVLTKPVPEVDLQSLHPVDRDAMRIAALGTNYANSSMIYVAYLERVMGFHVPHRTIEVPIDLLNRFTIAETGMLAWFDLLTDSGQPLRLERENASMAILTRAGAKSLASTGSAWLERTVVGPNQVNIAQIYQLGLSLMLGGAKMAVYIPEMNRWIPGFAGKIASWSRVLPPLVPITSTPLVELTGLSREAAYCEREWGISTSASLLASAEGEQAAERLEAMLAVDYAELFPAEAR